MAIDGYRTLGSKMAGLAFAEGLQRNLGKVAELCMYQREGVV